MKISVGTVAFATITAVLLTGCGGGIAGNTRSPTEQSKSLSAAETMSVTHLSPSQASAISVAVTPDFIDKNSAAYCKSSGGVVEVRRAVYGTNGPNQLQLAGIRGFCQYTAKDGSRIHILLTTLYTQEPTLAALAYEAKVPLSGSCQGNPASCYCTQLGGSDQFGGTSLAGGGWVLPSSIDQTLEACIFPDESSIDSWGLTYHSVGIIRGIDLNTVIRYHRT